MAFLPSLPLFLYTKSSSVVCGLAVVYLCLVRSLRWRRYNVIHKKYSAKFRAKSLTPEEAQDVIQLSYNWDMPFLSEYSLAFALFKTYGIPSISQLLLSTKQLASQALVAKRYADTEILIGHWLACPLAGRSVDAHPGAPADDPRASIALARVNWLHSKYKISNEDYLYTLGLFTFEPEAWAVRYGWRPLSPLERYATFVYWTEIGRKMDIKNIPSTPEEFRLWLRAYEEEHMIPAESNRDVAKHTMDELLFMVPQTFGMRSFAEGVTRSLLDDRTRIAMMQPEAPSYAKYLVSGLLGLFSFTQCYLLLPRRKPFAVVRVDLPKIGPSEFAPRLRPSKYTSKPWYKPRSRGLGMLLDRFLVFIGMHDDIPRLEYKSEGYRIHEVGPLRFEAEGHEEVMQMAAKLQGCPIAAAWKPPKAAAA
ncbi:hypothetical protein MSAN_01166800 [Mycena sanguinolenta]|uniref:ER-bound oxygenase mpaB/mpaB'/Rubber oxygenase catalytic domain-containing protein n=1 Tax=Mycena sanguinolenta TaxID=230812 RepID=A0A8H6YN81_9AGAR|nr:hypothetical protein MSAN_01166800 [Mycena sanguinolenta]